MFGPHALVTGNTFEKYSCGYRIDAFSIGLSNYKVAQQDLHIGTVVSASPRKARLPVANAAVIWKHCRAVV